MVKKNLPGETVIPPPSMPPLPQTAAHVDVQTVPAYVPPMVDVGGMPHEAHPVGTAQYIAELETEAAQHEADMAAVKGRASEGFKNIAASAIVHTAVMAGHLPQDIDAIPGIDAINAAGQA